MTLLNVTTLVPPAGEEWSFDVQLHKDKAHLRLGDVTLVADPADTLQALANVLVTLGRLIDEDTDTEEENIGIKEEATWGKPLDPYPFFKVDAEEVVPPGNIYINSFYAAGISQ